MLMENMMQFFQMRQELGLILAFLLMFVADLFLADRHRRLLHPVACVLLLVQMLVNVRPEEITLFGGMYHSSEAASVLKTILSFGTLIVFLQSTEWLDRPDAKHKTGEFYTLTMSTLIGMYFMVSAGHFLLFFLGLELATVPMACLVAFDKYKGNSAEAGAKFILYALFSSGIFLYGVSLVYGAVGSLYFDDIPADLHGCELHVLALVFIFSGLAFKLSLIPFHMWTPDTYQGAPTAVAGMLSAVSKGAAAFALLTIIFKVFGAMEMQWTRMISVVTVITITVGNLFAMRQQNMKRFMAYSSISQAGYLILAMLGDMQQGTASLVYYTVVYIVANLAVFGVMNAIEQKTHGMVDRDDYKGLYKTNPKLTMVMTLALFSLAGIPPFAGFFSKFMVFAAAFNQGFYLVVFLALINTVISLYYYLLVVKAMFIDENENPVEPFRCSTPMRISLILCLAGVLSFGLFSGIYQLLFSVA